MIEKRTKTIKYFEFENLSRQPGLIHFVSTRDSGNMAFTNHDGVKTKKNIINFLSEFSIPIYKAVFGYQVHKDNVAVVEDSTNFPDAETGLNIVPETDALITNLKNKCLIIKTADCTPIILFDQVVGALGIVHAGWKGLLNHISEKTVDKMIETFYSKPENIIAGIGPSLGPNDFYIRKDVQELFEKENINPDFVKKVSEEQWLVDGWEIVKEQLIGAGLLAKNIEISGVSTLKSNDFYSHRMKEPRGHFITGAMMLK